MNRERGFSLLELLIAVAIILIIATIAIPSLLRSRQSANDSAAVSNVRTINIEEATYSVSAGGNFGTLGALVTGGMLDGRFVGPVSGYNFTVNVSGPDYTLTATPIGLNSGRFGYYSTPDGVIRYQTSTSTTCSPCFPPGLSGLRLSKIKSSLRFLCFVPETEKRNPNRSCGLSRMLRRGWRRGQLKAL